MNNYQKIFIACFVALFSLFKLNVIFASPPSKSYSIDRIEISAEILSDGSLSIEENRSYTFRGNFRWADYLLPLQNLGRVIDFQLSEAGMIYRPGSDEEPGTYFLSKGVEYD